MNLVKINPEDLVFTYEIEDDRTNTFLTLNDYDWMEYTLRTSFKTKEMGLLEVEFSYFGMTVSTMKVVQYLNVKDSRSTLYVFEYPSELFQRYLTMFLEKHIKSWESEYAFNGEEEVISFFNEVLDKGVLTTTSIAKW